MWFSWGQTI
uniref:Uncharacterized protein n=1 Tax=Anguilla anguilla TaxID=7936 RepID=A0A0E9U693_ANGAN